MPVPGWRLRTSFEPTMPSSWKLGGMRMSETTTWGWAAVAPSTNPS